MSEQIEKVNGTWKGMPCSIKKEWKGHEFTVDERTKLFNDEIIEFEAISNKGNTFTTKGKLEKQKFIDQDGNEHEYVGFKPIFDESPEKFTGVWRGKEVKVKRVWGVNDNWNGHRFTDEEVTKLLNDEIISFEAVSKKAEANKYTAKGKLEDQSFTDQNGKEVKYVGFKLIFD